MSEAATQAKLSIFNDAMDVADKKAIEAFGSDSPTGAQASRRFARVAEFMLAIYPWTFTKSFVQMSKLATPPASLFDNVFEATGGGTVLALYDDLECTRPFLDFRKLGAYYPANADALWAEVRSNVPDDSILRWPQAFREAMVKALAADRVDSRTKRADLLAEAFGTGDAYPRGGLMATAAEEDGQIEPGGVMTLQLGSLLDARRS
ncbi:MAG: hypothetical protein WA989_09355 [Henriciella sp.]|uniref:hypothetical protein n=1 Tax=Henriciella sp. TaxID=1968823 RepID=UPI003C74005B